MRIFFIKLSYFFKIKIQKLIIKYIFFSFKDIHLFLEDKKNKFALQKVVTSKKKKKFIYKIFSTIYFL